MSHKRLVLGYGHQISSLELLALQSYSCMNGVRCRLGSVILYGLGYISDLKPLRGYSSGLARVQRGFALNAFNSIGVIL
jgi:hypothetical protein